MDTINNNQFEVKPIPSKRKVTARCPNVYLNPALDILANEDRICNTAMEIPVKKRKRSKSCDVVSFENSALDLGVKPINEVLVREIDNVRRNVKPNDFVSNPDKKRADLKSIDCNATKVDNVFQFIGDETDDVDFTNTADNTSIFDTTTQSQDNANITADTKESSLVTEPMYANLNDVQQIPNMYKKSVPVPPKTKEMHPLPIAETTVNLENTNTKDNLHCTDISRIASEGNDLDAGMSVLEQTSNLATEFSNVSNITNIQSNVTNQVIVNNSNLSLSFIDRLALDSPNVSDRSLFFDDDLNESNIMEIKTITIITKKKIIVEKKNTNPFLNPNLNTNIEVPQNNPFLDMKPEIEYQEEVLNRNEETVVSNNNALTPRRLFNNTNSTISTVDETSIESHEYENIDFLPDPIYENIDELNKQSKILGYDVSRFKDIDIMNINKKSKGDNSNESNESKKEKHSFFKPGKLSKKVFKTIKNTFKHDKTDNNVTLNPYEVPRKQPKQKIAAKESGIENPALKLDNSDDLEFEELSEDEEHQYETVKTMRNTRLNMNVTPLRERNDDVDLSSRMNTPTKKVRFDSTLNQEKVITGNSFDCGMASPGFDSKIEKQIYL
ncbi:Uncharacterized protein OBRU01_02227 [Operophtera brumata]|uniref:Uncharacterized protein n=1 Tax=Operophtera brumata TaxID=104452 RepID=A0A0L7LST7_OPEBR|nr:Uncharacterized protein OBRU01_02227 [Operophtera brumata]